MTSQMYDILDGAVGNVAEKAPCKLATIAEVTLSGEQTIDGVSVADGDRVLVKDQSDGTENGIYIVSTGDWTRAKDFDGNYDVVKSTAMYCGAGATQAAGIWRVTSSNPITIGTTELTFTQDASLSVGVDGSDPGVTQILTIQNPMRVASAIFTGTGAVSYASHAYITWTADSDEYSMISGNTFTVPADSDFAIFNAIIPIALDKNSFADLVIYHNGVAKARGQVMTGSNVATGNFAAHAVLGPITVAAGDTFKVSMRAATFGGGAAAGAFQNSSSYGTVLMDKGRAELTVWSSSAYVAPAISGLEWDVNGRLGIGAGTAADPSLTCRTDLDTGLYFPAANTLAMTGAGARQAQFASVASAVNYLQFTGATTTNSPILEGTGSDSAVGILFKTKGTTTDGEQFNGLIGGVADEGTSGNHFFYIEGAKVLKLTDTYWNPNVSYDGQPEGYIVMSSGKDTGAATTDVICGVISVESALYGQLGGNGQTVDGLTLMLGSKGPTGSVHFLTNGMITASVTGGANAAGDDQYAAANCIWIKGVQQGNSETPVIFVNGETNAGLKFYTGSGTGKTTFLGHNTAVSLLELRPGSTSAIQGFYMQAATTGNKPLLSVDAFNGYTSPDTNVGMSIATRGTGTLSLMTNTSVEQVRINHVASAVNYLQLQGAATGLSPRISAQGSDTDISLVYTSKGAGNHLFYSGDYTNLLLYIQHVASPVNYLNLFPSTTGNRVGMSAQGSDTNIDMGLSTKGTGAHYFYTGNFGRIGFKVVDVASSVNYLTAAGAATGSGAVLKAVGTDTNVALNLASQAAGAVSLMTNTSVEQFRAAHVASAVNYLEAKGAATGNAVALTAQGSDTNIGMNLSTKGTGTMRFYTGDVGALQVDITHTASAVNRISMNGGATGVAPSISSQGEAGNGLLIYVSGTGALDLKTANTAKHNLSLLTDGTVKFADSASFTANATATVTISNVAPAAVTTATIKKWLTIVDSTGTTLYIPAWGA